MIDVGSVESSVRICSMFAQYLPLLGIDTTTVTDTGSARVVLIVTVFLVLLGAALAVLTFQLWKSTKPDPEALGPLVEMSGRKFYKLDAIEQRQRLDVARPVVKDSATPTTTAVLLPSAESIEAIEPFESATPVDAADLVELQTAIIDEMFIDDSSVMEKVGIGPDSISWDDDEWPDVDDWSVPAKDVPRQRDWRLDVVDSAPANPVAPEPRGRESIDPLLGF